MVTIIRERTMAISRVKGREGYGVTRFSNVNDEEIRETMIINSVKELIDLRDAITGMVNIINS